MIGKGSICQWFKTIISLSPIGLTVILNTGSFHSHQLSNIYGTFELWFPWKTFTNVWLKFRLQADTLYVFNEFMGIENYFMIKQQPIYDGQIFYSDFRIEYSKTSLWHVALSSIISTFSANVLTFRSLFNWLHQLLDNYQCQKWTVQSWIFIFPKLNLQVPISHADEI